MKRVLKIAVGIIFLTGGIAAWIFLGAATGFTSGKEYLYIRTDGATKQAVLDSVRKNNLVTNVTAFSFLAERLGYWDNIKPGKYEITKGASLLSIVRMLRNGTQSQVDLVISKLRTKESFARLAGSKFEFDSTQMIAFLNNGDALQLLNADTITALWNVLPDTYRFNWTASPEAVYQKLAGESKKFWTPERKTQAATIGLSPMQAYTLASIIEEETTNNEEKDTIASVYLNRLKKGMPLQADPTLKFAVRSFGLKFIAGPILNVVSPYNTYKNKGLPPGPICIPSKITIDAVLKPAATSYYYFVANRKLIGHLFSETFSEHVIKANQYREDDKLRRAADSLKKLKKN